MLTANEVAAEYGWLFEVFEDFVAEDRVDGNDRVADDGHLWLTVQP